MRETIEKITDAELQVLRVLWSAEKPLPMSGILAAFSGERWEPSTVKTLVYRLRDKGALVVAKDGVNTYFPDVSEREYRDHVTNALIERCYGGSALRLVEALVERDAFSGEEKRVLLIKTSGGGTVRPPSRRDR
ncbi:BlaI/MecI/CopY family transcriptional regulator [Oscillospiraceae bacterium OttesenSCG-928-G22]|nr:BlaI/MecI/CopY family transcriptional regulator [Oscillospiraceae bacterium OttesenSCG-928-G22]